MLRILLKDGKMLEERKARILGLSGTIKLNSRKNRWK
jgi:hypothetical protein